MLVKTLNQQNPCLDREHLVDLLAMYSGGKRFEKRIQRFLPQNQGESNPKYNKRLQQAPFRSYIGPIIDKFAALLLSSPPNAQVLGEDEAQTEPEEFWLKWRDDVDGSGADCREFFREQFSNALMKKRALWVINKPQGEVDNKKEWDELGMGNVSLKGLESQDVLNWKTDSVGRLEWLVHFESELVQELPTEEQNKTRATWTIYDRQKTDTYSIVFDTKKGLKEKDDVPLVSSVLHGLDELPIICLVIPDGLWVAERLYSAQLEHFRLSAALSWSFKASCYAMPMFRTQDGKPPAMGEGNAIVLSAKSEDGGEEGVEWLVPPTNHIDAMRAEIADQKDEIYRVVHQMADSASNSAAATSRSALSKVQDTKSTNIILESYSTLLRDAIQKTYRLAARLRGEDIDWVITGLDRYEGIDLPSLIEVVEGVAVSIESETFHVEVQSLVVDELLTNIDEQTRGKIRDEIKAGVAEKKKLQREQEQQRLALMHGLGGQNDQQGAAGEGSPGQGKANATGGSALPGKRGKLPAPGRKNAPLPASP